LLPFYVDMSQSFSNDDNDSNVGELTYSDVAKMLRNNLLADAKDIPDAKKKLQNIFNHLDTDQNGILTTSELRLLLEELSFAKHTENPNQTMDLLIEQIDVNRFATLLHSMHFN
jgi:Ca2+-binding EF-hand superfamily protein